MQPMCGLGSELDGRRAHVKHESCRTTRSICAACCTCSVPRAMCRVQRAPVPPSSPTHTDRHTASSPVGVGIVVE